MHFVEHETQLPGLTNAYEITWETCVCGQPADHAPHASAEFVDLFGAWEPIPA